MKNMEQGEIEQLLRDVATGDHIAFRQIFDAYKNKVYSYAIRYLKYEDRSEEIVQEIFLKLWTKRDKLPSIENFGGFLRRITINATIDALKKNSLNQNHINISQLQWNEADGGTEDYLYRRDSEAYVKSLIDKLPPQQRKVYTLFNIDGLKQKKIAEEMNISVLTVKVHLRNAIKNLRQMINGNPTVLLTLAFLGLLK